MDPPPQLQLSRTDTGEPEGREGDRLGGESQPGRRRQLPGADPVPPRQGSDLPLPGSLSVSPGSGGSDLGPCRGEGHIQGMPLRSPLEEE